MARSFFGGQVRFCVFCFGVGGRVEFFLGGGRSVINILKMKLLRGWPICRGELVV